MTFFFQDQALDKWKGLNSSPASGFNLSVQIVLTVPLHLFLSSWEADSSKVVKQMLMISPGKTHFLLTHQGMPWDFSSPTTSQSLSWLSSLSPFSLLHLERGKKKSLLVSYLLFLSSLKIPHSQPYRESPTLRGLSRRTLCKEDSQ